MTVQPRVFISYAREDEDFARELRERLEREARITVWQDRTHMEGGKAWWRQITDALDAAEYLVLVMSPAAFRSEYTQMEWRYARQQGVCICPVMGPAKTALDFKSIPKWMSKIKFHDLNHEWSTFIRRLETPCRAERVPFMAPDPPEHFVMRPAEFDWLLEQLIDPAKKDAVAVTIALHGFPGMGKTTLAAALCNEDDIINAFDDGILWVTLGTDPDLRSCLAKIYAALTGERPPFEDADDAAFCVSEKLEGKDCLMVIDDVWNPAHLEPFMRGGKGCARLITTRQTGVASRAKPKPIDVMTSTEAVQMLISRFGDERVNLVAFRNLARTLGEWPLLLELASSAMLQRMTHDYTMEESLSYVARRFEKYGPEAFDHRDPVNRRQAVSVTMGLSLSLLGVEERRRYCELAIFPEHTDILLTTAAKLWDLDESEARDLAEELLDFSLLKIDTRLSTIRLHEAVRAYLNEHVTDAEELHSKLVDAWGDLHRLPDTYAWSWLGYHMLNAGREREFLDLLLDFDWIQAKLDRTHIDALITDYALLTDVPDLGLVQAALRLSAHILSKDKSQLAGQIVGRLIHFDSPALNTLRRRAGKRRGVWLCPVSKSLTPPGGALQRTLAGHTGHVTTLAITHDGKHVISGSDDNTVKIWNLATGKEDCTLEGHAGRVTALTLTPDGKRLISGSSDSAIKIWNSATGEVERTLEGHEGGVTALTVTPDSKYVVSGASDCSIRTWDLAAGKEEHTFKGHKGWVTALAAMPDGKHVVSGSHDKTIRIWCLGRDKEVQVLKGHTSWVTTLAVTPDGKHVVSGASDDAIKIWDVTIGVVERTVRGYTGWVTALTLTPDGKHGISGSHDGKIRIWDLTTGQNERTFPGHTSWVNTVVVTPDGSHLISGARENTVRIWDLRTANVELLLEGHTGGVNAVAITPDGRHAVSGANEKTIKIWDLTSGAEERAHENHKGWVTALAVTPDGKHAVSGSSDYTIRIWDLITGEEERILEGHTSGVNAVTITPDGQYVVSGSHDGIIKIWNIATGEEEHTLRGHTGVVNSVAVTPDGRHVVSASGDRTIKIWDVLTGTEEHTLRGHAGWVNAVAITPEGKQVISGSSDETAKIWDIATGREKRSLGEHTGWVNAVAVTPDGKHMVLAVSGAGLEVLSLPEAKIEAGLAVDSQVTACAVSPDGRTVVAGADSGRVHILRLMGPD